MMPPWLWLRLVGDLAVLIPAEVSNERHQIALYTGHGEIAPQVTTGTPYTLLLLFTILSTRGSSVTTRSGTAAPPENTSGRIKSMSEPTGKYSITMPRDIAEAARARSGPSGLSGYVAAAVARQIERDNLNELIAVAEAEHGPVTEEEVQARREELRRARAGQGHPRSGAA
jgi:hypothetical protein